MERNLKVMKSLIATAIFLVAAIVMILIYQNNNSANKAVVGNKDITIHVIVPEEETKNYEFSTDAEFLRQALDENDLIAGEEGAYGYFLTAVNGRTADSDKQEWWCITKSGEDVFTGVDQTPIQDGEEYELTLMIGY